MKSDYAICGNSEAQANARSGMIQALVNDPMLLADIRSALSPATLCVVLQGQIDNTLHQRQSDTPWLDRMADGHPEVIYELVSEFGMLDTSELGELSRARGFDGEGHGYTISVRNGEVFVRQEAEDKDVVLYWVADLVYAYWGPDGKLEEYDFSTGGCESRYVELYSYDLNDLTQMDDVELDNLVSPSKIYAAMQITPMDNWSDRSLRAAASRLSRWMDDYCSGVCKYVEAKLSSAVSLIHSSDGLVHMTIEGWQHEAIWDCRKGPIGVLAVGPADDGLSPGTLEFRLTRADVHTYWCSDSDK